MRQLTSLGKSTAQIVVWTNLDATHCITIRILDFAKEETIWTGLVANGSEFFAYSK